MVDIHLPQEQEGDSLLGCYTHPFPLRGDVVTVDGTHFCKSPCGNWIDMEDCDNILKFDNDTWKLWFHNHLRNIVIYGNPQNGKRNFIFDTTLRVVHCPIG